MASQTPRRPITEDMLAGGFFVLCAVAIFVFSRNLTLGNSFQPGAGYLPTGIAALLLVLGLIIAGPDLLDRTRGLAFTAPKMRPFLAVLGILAFGLLIKPLGFILAALVLITPAFAAYGRVRLLELALLSLVLVVACILIFIVGLGQRIPLLP
ncbi:tripartite tricarboxylate transporter TctB family protein [Devosia sp. A369]